MRKKEIINSVCIVATVVISLVAAFVLGRKSMEYQNTLWESTNYVLNNLEDWNTDGHELSLTLKDGSEWYAYKEQSDIINLNNVAGFSLDGDILELEMESGDVFRLYR